MQEYFLASDVYGCEIDDGAILLELTAHKYFAIGSPYVHALRHAVPDWPRAAGRNDNDCLDRNGDAERLLEELTQKGFLTRSGARKKSGVLSVTPAENSFAMANRSELDYPIGPLDAIRFAMAFLRATRDLRLGRLKLIVNRFDARRASGFAATDTDIQLERVEQLVKIFLRLRPWVYSAKSACLLDSIALMEFLAYYRVTPALVIGVNTKPFAAHAWVQMGSTVLNDTPEHVHEYTPIMSA
jgi:hypothetical protein